MQRRTSNLARSSVERRQSDAKASFSHENIKALDGRVRDDITSVPHLQQHRMNMRYIQLHVYPRTDD